MIMRKYDTKKYNVNYFHLYMKPSTNPDRSGVYLQCHGVYTADTLLDMTYAVYLQNRLLVHC